LRCPGVTATSQYFVMDWVWVDVAVGLLVAGALAAWVPESFWQGFFLVDHPQLAKLWGPLVGPVVAVVSFVCSIGNVPLAAVLWNGGISFGGVAAFIYADLIVLPILNIVFLVLAAVLIARFLRTGGPAMLRMMNMAPVDHGEHRHMEVSSSDRGPHDEAHEGATYSCPMHPEVRSSTPGSCPKCGMPLEATNPGA
jgi:hypothetical protein